MKISSEMVDTMAAVRRGEDKEIAGIEEALVFASSAIREYGCEDAAGELEEYKNILISLTSLFSPGACDEIIDALAMKLYKKQRISSDEIEEFFPGVSDASEFTEELYRLTSEYEKDAHERRRMDAVAREYDLISKMINDARVRRDEGGGVDEELSVRLSSVFTSAGFPDGAIRAYGGRRA